MLLNYDKGQGVPLEYLHAGRNAGCDPLRSGVPRHAVQRMAFRQEPRTTLAHCGSTLYYGSWVAGTHPTAELDPGDSRIVHHGVRIYGVSLELLGDTPSARCISFSEACSGEGNCRELPGSQLP